MDGSFGRCSVASPDDCDKCALDPSPRNCCDEDEQRLVDGSAQTNLPLMIFDVKSRQCVCPEGTTRRTNEYGFPECFCTNVAANKAKCCPGEPQEEGICWKFAGKWVLQTKTTAPGGGWGQSDCNIPTNGSAASGTWECSEDDIGKTCTVIDDYHCTWNEEWSGDCGDTVKTIWKCSKTYVHNGW